MHPRIIAPTLLLALALIGCGEKLEFIDDVSGESFTLVDQDSSTVTFPGDYAGKTLVVGYIFTHCPDICPMTTANMRNVRQALGAPDDVQFVTISFDPARDTPSVLKNYARAYGLQDTGWAFLTGSPDEIEALMQRMKINLERTPVPGVPDSVAYFFNHTDQISVIDPKGRVFFHYGGSNTPTNILVDDIKEIR